MTKETTQRASLKNSFIAIVAGILAAIVAGLILYLPAYGVALAYHEGSPADKVFIFYPTLFIFLYIPALSAGWACARLASRKETEHAIFLVTLMIIAQVILFIDAPPKWRDFSETAIISCIGALGIWSGLKIAMRKKQKERNQSFNTENEILPQDAFKID